jgi:hypothetical protein
MTLGSDTTPFLAEFGRDFTRESDDATVRVLLNRPSVEAAGITGEAIRGTVAAPWTVAAGNVLRRGTERLEVVSVQPDACHGSAVLVLESLGHEVDVLPLEGPLSVVYLDEAYPLYPAIDAPGQHEPEFTYVSSGPSKRHALVFVGPLAPTVIPTNARVDWAMLYVAADAAYPGPHITVHSVLQAVIPGQVNWTRYATGHNWSEPGCAGVNVDYFEDEYTFRNGLPAGSLRLVNSMDVAKVLDAAKTEVVPFLIRASGANATARFYSELGDNGGNRPLLRLRYTVPRV